MNIGYIFYGLAVAMSLGLVIFLWREKVRSKQKRIVNIEDLARLWMSEEDLEEAKEMLKMQGSSSALADTIPTVDLGLISDISAVPITEEPLPERQKQERDQPPEIVPQEMFTSQRIQDFCMTYIVPRQQIFYTCKALDPLLSILKALDEKGSCPSLQPRGVEMEEWEDSDMDLEPLMKVPLLEHAINTCEEIVSIKTSQSQKPPGGGVLARLMLAGLGHDLGKIPEYFNKYGGSSHKKHSIVSSRVLEDLIPDAYASKQDVIKAVQDHHFFVKNTENDIYLLLRRADKDARIKEGRSLGIEYMQARIDHDRRENTRTQKDTPKQTAKEYRDQPTGLGAPNLEWLDTDQLLKLLSPVVNMEVDRRFQAFALGGDDIVYCQVGQISETVVTMGKKEGHADLTKYQQDTNTKRQLERAIIERMRSSGQITPHTKPGFTCRKFTVKFTNQKDIEGYYTTIYAHKFPNTEADFVARKKGTALINNIKQVVPAG